MFAVVFPGQGSQKPGMGREFVERGGPAAEVFHRVSAAVGEDLRKICFELDEDTLRQTQNAQLALYTAGVAAWQELCAVLNEKNLGAPRAMAGHSVGEYAALAAAGVVTVEEGAKLVHRRGEVMASSGKRQPGTMAAVMGLEREALEDVCRRAGGIVVVANDNCPGQLVISGEVEAVGRAGELASEAGAKRVIPLNVSGAFHSPLMEEPAQGMRDLLAVTAFEHDPTHPQVFSNVTAEAVTVADEWPKLLEEQLRRPVRWTESVQAMIAGGVTHFVEAGVGEVLGGLTRRIDRSAISMKVADPASLEETAKTLGDQVSGVGA